MSQSAENGLRVYPCCVHCVPEENGLCWAHEAGHGCSCLDCDRVIPPAEGH